MLSYSGAGIKSGAGGFNLGGFLGLEKGKGVFAGRFFGFEGKIFPQCFGRWLDDWDWLPALHPALFPEVWHRDGG